MPENLIEEHGGHRVQWMTWEGMLYRLYCLDCYKYLDWTSQNPSEGITVPFILEMKNGN